MNCLLEFRDVRFAHREREVLAGVDLCVRPGEAIALLGPNGAGKSTLLRLAAGLLAADSGEVLFAGTALAGSPQRQRARRIALVPQHLHVPFAFTVQQLVEQARSPHLGRLGRLSSADRDAVERALVLTGTQPFRTRIFQELSGGEQQRVKLALGLAQAADLLLLDEPAQSLDPGWQRAILATIRNLRDAGTAVVAAVHELHLAADYFDTALLLAPGRPAEYGPTGAILASPTLHDAFFAPHGYARHGDAAAVAAPPRTP